MIEARDLTVTYDGRAVLREVDLTVPDGAHIALMGPSGCGKTTLLRVLAGLQAPDSGTVRVEPGRMSCVFQEPRLLPWRTAAENVNAVLSDRAQTMPQALAWLARRAVSRPGRGAARSCDRADRGRGERQDPRACHARRGRRRRARLRGVCVCRRCVPPGRSLSRRRVRLFKPSPQGEGDARPVPPQGTGHKNSAPRRNDAGRSFFYLCYAALTRPSRSCPRATPRTWRACGRSGGRTPSSPATTAGRTRRG